MIVADTILQQLGGSRFVAMTGARAFVGGERELQFSLPARVAKHGINKVRIVLDGNDTYRVEFYKLLSRGLVARCITSRDGVYAEALRSFFTFVTGLDTTL